MTNLWRPLAPLLGEIEICIYRIFCRKFNTVQLLFETFFDMQQRSALKWTCFLISVHYKICQHSPWSLIHLISTSAAGLWFYRLLHNLLANCSFIIPSEPKLVFSTNTKDISCSIEAEFMLFCKCLYSPAIRLLKWNFYAHIRWGVKM